MGDADLGLELDAATGTATDAGASSPRVYSTADGQIAVFVPPLQPAPLAGRVVTLLVDVSGSMSQLARADLSNAVETVLHGLAESNALVKLFAFSDKIYVLDFAKQKTTVAVTCAFDRESTAPVSERFSVEQHIAPGASGVAPAVMDTGYIAWILETMLGTNDFYKGGLIGGYTWLGTAMVYGIQDAWAALGTSAADADASVIVIGDGAEMFGVMSNSQRVCRPTSMLCADVASALSVTHGRIRCHMLALGDGASLPAFQALADVGGGTLSYMHHISDLGHAFGKLLEVAMLRPRTLVLDAATPAAVVEACQTAAAAARASCCGLTQRPLPKKPQDGAATPRVVMGRLPQGGVMTLGSTGSGAEFVMVDSANPGHVARLTSTGGDDFPPLPPVLQGELRGAEFMRQLCEIFTEALEKPAGIEVTRVQTLLDEIVACINALQAQHSALVDGGGGGTVAAKKLGQDAATQYLSLPLLEKAVMYAKAFLQVAATTGATRVSVTAAAHAARWRAAAAATFHLARFSLLTSVTPPAECQDMLRRVDMGFSASRVYDALKLEMDAWIDADEEARGRYRGFTFESGLMGIPVEPKLSSRADVGRLAYASLCRSSNIEACLPLTISQDGSLVELQEFDDLRRRGRHVDGAAVESIVVGPDGDMTVGGKTIRDGRMKKLAGHVLSASKTAVRTSVSAMSFLVPIVLRPQDAESQDLRRMVLMRLAEIQRHDRLDWQHPKLVLQVYGQLCADLFLEFVFTGSTPAPRLQTAADLFRSLVLLTTHDVSIRTLHDNVLYRLTRRGGGWDEPVECHNLAVAAVWLAAVGRDHRTLTLATLESLWTQTIRRGYKHCSSAVLNHPERVHPMAFLREAAKMIRTANGMVKLAKGLAHVRDAIVNSAPLDAATIEALQNSLKLTPVFDAATAPRKRFDALVADSPFTSRNMMIAAAASAAPTERFTRITALTWIREGMQAEDELLELCQLGAVLKTDDCLQVVKLLSDEPHHDLTLDMCDKIVQWVRVNAGEFVAGPGRFRRLNAVSYHGTKLLSALLELDEVKTAQADREAAALAREAEVKRRMEALFAKLVRNRPASSSASVSEVAEGFVHLLAEVKRIMGCVLSQQSMLCARRDMPLKPSRNQDKLLKKVTNLLRNSTPRITRALITTTLGVDVGTEAGAKFCAWALKSTECSTLSLLLLQVSTTATVTAISTLVSPSARTSAPCSCLRPC